MYTLTINRYGRYLSFDTLDELKEELSGYFSTKEKDLVNKLLDFSKTPTIDGYKKNIYQDYTVCCYNCN